MNSRKIVLSREEEARLLKLALQGDSCAEKKLVSSLMPFVVHIARRYKAYDVPLADLIQEGTIGLLQAVRRFNPDKKTRLSTYSMWWIRAAMQDYVVRSWSLVRLGTQPYHRNLFFKFRQKFNSDGAEGKDNLDTDLPHDLSEPGLPEEEMDRGKWAHLYNMSKAELASFRRRVTMKDLSLNSWCPWRHKEDESDAFLINLLPDIGPTPEDQVTAQKSHQVMLQNLYKAVAKLSDREQIIIKGRFLGDQKIPRTSLGAQLGISKDRVRQLEQAALEKLKSLIAKVDFLDHSSRCYQSERLGLERIS